MKTLLAIAVVAMVAVPVVADASLQLRIIGPNPPFGHKTVEVSLSKSPINTAGLDPLFSCSLQEIGYPTGTYITLFQYQSHRNKYAGEIYLKLFGGHSRYIFVSEVGLKKMGPAQQQLYFSTDIKGSRIKDPLILSIDLRRNSETPDGHPAFWSPVLILHDSEDPENRSSREEPKNGYLPMVCKDLDASR